MNRPQELYESSTYGRTIVGNENARHVSNVQQSTGGALLVVCLMPDKLRDLNVHTL
jgi:hypothetical protein